MSFKTSIILFSAFIFLGAGGYILARNGFYPIAAVNGDFIFEKTVDEDFMAAYKYFQNMLLASGSDPQTLNTQQALMEIKRATLDKLITDSLILNELEKRVKKDEYNMIAERNIQAVVASNKNIENSAKQIYGLDFNDFKSMVLLPQAYREILEGRMFLNQEDFNKWLANAKASAWVVVLSSKLKWDGNSVKF